jgi:hypothetical protein
MKAEGTGSANGPSRMARDKSRMSTRLTEEREATNAEGNNEDK